MHEWSIAAAIIHSVEAWALRNSVERIVKVTVEIPSTAALDIEVLKDAFKTLREGTRLKEAELEVKIVKPRVRCRACDYVFTDEDVERQVEALRKEYGEEYPLHLMPELLPMFVRCPRCGSNDLEVENPGIKVTEVVVP